MDKIDEVRKKIKKDIKITASEEKAYGNHVMDLLDTVPEKIKEALDEGRLTDEMRGAYEVLIAGLINILLEATGEIPPESEDFIKYLTSKGYQIDKPEHKKRKDNIRVLRRKKSTAFRNKVMQRFGRRCFNCGTANNLNIDHHFPAKDWTELTENNAVVLCESCNKQKGTKAPEDFYSIKQLSVLNELYDIAKTALEISEDSLSESISAFDICRFLQQKR